MGSIVDLAASHPLFDSLSARELKAVVSSALEIHHAPGELVYTSGQRALTVHLLLRGAMQIEYPLPSKSRGPVAGILVAPSIFGECQSLFGRPWSGTGVTLHDIVLLAFRREAWIELLERSPVVSRRLYAELAGRFLHAIELARHRPGERPKRRIARYCAGVSRALFLAGHIDPTDLSIAQKEIGRATGLTRETVNRVLKELSELNIVAVRRGRVRLVDIERLASVAGKDWGAFVRRYELPDDL